MEILDDLLAKMFSFGYNVVILMWTCTLWFVKMQIKKTRVIIQMLPNHFDVKNYGHKNSGPFCSIQNLSARIKFLFIKSMTII